MKAAIAIERSDSENRGLEQGFAIRPQGSAIRYAAVEYQYYCLNGAKRFEALPIRTVNDFCKGLRSLDSSFWVDWHAHLVCIEVEIELEEPVEAIQSVAIRLGVDDDGFIIAPHRAGERVESDQAAAFIGRRNAVVRWELPIELQDALIEAVHQRNGVIPVGRMDRW